MFLFHKRTQKHTRVFTLLQKHTKSDIACLDEKELILEIVGMTNTEDGVLYLGVEEYDAEKLIDYLKITAAETPFLIREPDEIALSIKQEQDFIKIKKASKNELLLIAEIGGKHIGNCSLMTIGGYKRYRHRCEIAIALYKEYCGLGIGKAMLELVLDTAEKMGYEQAELEVIASNRTAIALYEKLGFKIYGTFPNSMKYGEGSYADAYWMMKKLRS